MADKIQMNMRSIDTKRDHAVGIRDKFDIDPKTGKGKIKLVVHKHMDAGVEKKEVILFDISELKEAGSLKFVTEAGFTDYANFLSTAKLGSAVLVTKADVIGVPAGQVGVAIISKQSTTTGTGEATLILPGVEGLRWLADKASGITAFQNAVDVPDYTTVTFNVKTQPLYDADGNVIGVEEVATKAAILMKTPDGLMVFENQEDARAYVDSEISKLETKLNDKIKYNEDDIQINADNITELEGEQSIQDARLDILEAQAAGIENTWIGTAAIIPDVLTATTKGTYRLETLQTNDDTGTPQTGGNKGAFDFSDDKKFYVKFELDGDWERFEVRVGEPAKLVAIHGETKFKIALNNAGVLQISEYDHTHHGATHSLANLQLTEVETFVATGAGATFGTLDEVYKIESGVTIDSSNQKVLNIDEVATLVKAQRTIDDGALTDFTDTITITKIGATGKLEYRDSLKVADGAPLEDVVTSVVNANITGANIGYATLIHPYDRIAQPGAWFEATAKQAMTVKYTFPGSSKGVGFFLAKGEKYKWETVAKYEGNKLVMYVKFTCDGNILISNNALTPTATWPASGSTWEYKLDEIMPNGSRFALAQMESEDDGGTTHTWAVGDEVLSLTYHTTLSFVKSRLLRLIKDMQEPVRQTLAKSEDDMSHVDVITTNTAAAVWVKSDIGGTDNQYVGFSLEDGKAPNITFREKGKAPHVIDLNKLAPQNNLLTGRIGDSQVYELNTMVPYDHRFKVKSSLGIYDIGHNTDAPQNNRFMELELKAGSHNIELPLVDNWYFLKTPYELGGSSYYGVGADSGPVMGGTIRFKVKVYANQSHIIDSFNRVEITEIDLYDPFAGKTVDITAGGNPLSLKWTKGMPANSEQHKLLAKRDWLKELRMVNV